jgi:hypothetical protein
MKRGALREDEKTVPTAKAGYCSVFCGTAEAVPFRKIEFSRKLLKPRIAIVPGYRALFFCRLEISSGLNAYTRAQALDLQATLSGFENPLPRTEVRGYTNRLG